MHLQLDWGLLVKAISRRVGDHSMSGKHLDLLPWRWRQCVPRKCWVTSYNDVITHKINCHGFGNLKSHTRSRFIAFISQRQFRNWGMYCPVTRVDRVLFDKCKDKGTR
jgi:hypothetical protein